MILYHGEFCEIKAPIIRNGKFTKDFGNGFYCTELKEQAKRWASKFDTSVVSFYEYVKQDNLDIPEFTEMTDEWLDFVVDCRHGKPHAHDIVIGAMADDQIYTQINSYIAGQIPRDVFFRLASF